MGKKAREEKQRHQAQQEALNQQDQGHKELKAKGLEPFLLWLIRLGTAAVLFTPLVIHNRLYFPFVGPKALYLMGCCQVVFFAWLFLAIHYKRYRPNINKVFMAFVLFLIVLGLASLFGVDFSRSFWSKYERMTGLLVWLHLFGWFLAISSSFRKLSDWIGVFRVSMAAASLVAFLSLLGEVGVAVYKLGGSSLGNTSFLGTYLLFNVFFGLYLFFEEKSKYLKAAAAAAVVLCGLAIYCAGARAATLGTIGGLGLIGLLWLSFKVKRRWVRITGRVALAVSSLTVFFLVVLLFVPGSFVLNKFIELTTASRFVNWQMAWKGFLERPLFGWGPENYTVLFPKFFNPCLYTAKCGGEIWFDRTHNVVLDTLATTGIFGLCAYLGLFATMAYILIKKYFKQKTIGFWLFAVFLSLLCAYFVQNLTVFDMPATLMLFAFVVGFMAFLASKPRQEPLGARPGRAWVAVLLVIVFLCTFFEFVIQPTRTDAFVIKAVTAKDPNERLLYYKKAFEASPVGKYQIRDYFAQRTQDFVQKNLERAFEERALKEMLVRELDFIIAEQVKTRKECPVDFRATLKLAQIHNVYALLDISKLALAEKYGKEALALSPTHQLAYWALVQTKIYQKDFDRAIELAQTVVDLEPEWLQSHRILVEVAQRADRPEKAKEFAQKAVEMNPEWALEFKDVLGGLEENPSEP